MRQYTRDRVQPSGLEKMKKLAGCVVYINRKRIVGRTVYVASFSEPVGVLDHNGVRYTVLRTLTDDGEYWTAQPSQEEARAS
jgi:hypothetical protein